MTKSLTGLGLIFASSLLLGASCGGLKGGDFELSLNEKPLIDKNPEAGKRDAALEAELLPLVQKAFDEELDEPKLFQVSEVYALDTEYEVVQTHAKAMTADHKLVNTGRSFIGGRQSRYWAIGKTKNGVCAAISVLDYQDRKDGAWQEHEITVNYTFSEALNRPRVWNRLACPK